MTPVRLRSLALIMIVLLASQLTACGLLQKIGLLPAPEEASPAIQAPLPLSQQPYELQLRLSADDNLNPDARSTPSPVQIRIFLMEQPSDMKSRDFEELFDYAGNVMDPRPLSIMTIQPGQIRDIVIPGKKSQTLLVIAAAFRDPYQARWKAIAVISPVADTVAATVNIGASTVTINPSP